MKTRMSFSAAVSLFAVLALTACGGGGTDTTKPTVSLSGPTSITAAGSVTYTATASDASGIASVKFYRGSTLLGTDTTAPYEQAMTFSASDNGSQTITATATDTAGNSASASQSVAVNIGGGSSGLITRLSACTPVNTSSDPAASVCLAGTYNGKTIDNKDCSLTVRADGSHDYASPTLNYTVTPAMISTRMFTYTRTLSTNQITWLISGTSTPNVYELTFSALWGSTAPIQKLEIKADIRYGAASTCLVPLP